MYNLYSSGNYNFEYAAMIIDMNGTANSYLNNNYNLAWVPSSYIDGGDEIYIGTSEGDLAVSLIQAGRRQANDIDLSVTLTWLGSARLEVAVTVVNNQFFNTTPDRPDIPSGPPTGTTQAEYDIVASAVDADGQNLWYMFNWGNGFFSDWIGPSPSGQNLTTSYAWPGNGTFYYRVKAKDEYNAESPWSSSRIISIVPRGDANGDSGINVGDAVFVINYVFKGGPASNPIERGDANCDQDTNVGDAVYLINHVFKGGSTPGCP